MGISTSWVAIQGAKLEEVARTLGLVPLDPDRTTTTAEARFQAAVLASGWLLLVQRMEADGVVAGRAPLEALSQTWRVVGCDEESHVMYSSASEWQRGLEVWALVHEFERAADHLDVRGVPPDGWKDVRDKCLSEQATVGSGVDYVYEIPLVVAQRVVGYRTETDDDDELIFVPLDLVANGTPKRWWRFW